MADPAALDAVFARLASVDEALIGELEAILRRGYEAMAGNPAWGAAKRVEHGMAHRRAGAELETAPGG